MTKSNEGHVATIKQTIIDALISLAHPKHQMQFYAAQTVDHVDLLRAAMGHQLHRPATDADMHAVAFVLEEMIESVRGKATVDQAMIGELVVSETPATIRADQIVVQNMTVYNGGGENLGDTMRDGLSKLAELMRSGQTVVRVVNEPISVNVAPIRIDGDPGSLHEKLKVVLGSDPVVKFPGRAPQTGDAPMEKGAG